MYLIVSEANDYHEYAKVPGVVIGDVSDAESMLSMMADWKVIRGATFTVHTRQFGEGSTVRVYVK